MSLHRTFFIVTKSITDSFAVTALSYQHSLFSQKCTSASLDCIDNTITTGLPISPPAPSPPPQPPAALPPKEPPIPMPPAPPQAPPNPPGGKLLV